MSDLATQPRPLASHALDAGQGPLSPPAERPLSRRIALATGWLLVAAAIAFGSAGIVAATEHSPASGSRDELTWGADQAIQPGLRQAVADLQRVVLDVDTLGAMARNARAAVTQRDEAALTAALGDGDAALQAMQKDQAAVRAGLAALPGVGPRMETRLGGSLVERYRQVLAALDGTNGLANDWSEVSDGSRQALQVGNLLVQHDQVAGEAVQLGGKGQYKAAITRLKDATAILATAGQLRDLLAKLADVSTLTDWLDRSQAMDNALANLWQAILTSNGRATKQVTDALKAVAVAKELLPVDTRYLDVVMSEVAGWFNQAAISIETARGQLSAAASDLAGQDSGQSP